MGRQLLSTYRIRRRVGVRRAVRPDLGQALAAYRRIGVAPSTSVGVDHVVEPGIVRDHAVIVAPGSGQWSRPIANLSLSKKRRTFEEAPVSMSPTGLASRPPQLGGNPDADCPHLLMEFTHAPPDRRQADRTRDQVDRPRRDAGAHRRAGCPRRQARRRQEQRVRRRQEQRAVVLGPLLG